MSPIPEGTEHTGTDTDNTTAAADDDVADIRSLLTLYSDFDDQSVRSELESALSDIESVMVEVDSEQCLQDVADATGCFLPELSGEALLAGLPLDAELEDKVYLEFPGPYGKLLDGVAEALPIGQAYAPSSDAVSRKKQVVSTDSDLLTADEVKQHRTQVLEAMRLELATWHRHDCFERRSRRIARNIIDCRWVLK